MHRDGPVEFAFIDRRQGDDVKELAARLCELHAAGIAIFLASPPVKPGDQEDTTVQPGETVFCGAGVQVYRRQRNL